METAIPVSNIVFRNIGEILQHRAKVTPEDVAYTFLPDGEQVEQNITYAQLDLKARAVAASLQNCAGAGERALLMFPSGLDYIVALFGCFYSGVIAAPAYPLKPARNSHHNARVKSIIKDARPKAILSPAAAIERARKSVFDDLAGQQAHWIGTDALPEDAHTGWRDPGVSETDIAFLQYTSGSTATPKGVMVSHLNLLHNERMIQAAFGQSESSRIIGWLPLYHDMGLIGNVLQPLYLGARSVLMPPTAFLQRPVRWLKAISRYRGSTSGGPNFAYDLCVDRVAESEKEGLDLSSWTVAFNGAEPVRPETLERFTKAFEGYGFRSRAFYPCYGLAEASLMVTGAASGAEPVIRRVDVRAMGRGHADDQSNQIEGTRVFVGCGRPVEDTRVVIVNPETCRPVEPGEFGEIWISGPAVTCGYWGRPEATERLFRAKLDGGPEGGFLRTQDCGFIDGEVLFIAGRLQDLIIIRGQNHHPEDIEWTIRRSGLPIAVGAIAAFSIDGGDVERVVALIEVDRRGQSVPATLDKVAQLVRRAVAERHELQIQAIGFVKLGSLAKTSSGKIQRRLCKHRYLSGALKLLWHSALTGNVSAIPVMALSREDLVAAPEPARRTLLECYLQAHVSRLVGMSEVDVTTPLIEFGLDSAMVVQLKTIVEIELAVVLEFETLLGGSSVRDVAGVIVEEMQNGNGLTTPPLRRADRTQILPLSYAQRRLWFIDQLEPESTLYNVPAAVQLEGNLDVAALKSSLQEIVRRHEALRTRFTSVAGEPTQIISEQYEIDLPVTDLSIVSAERRLPMADRLKAEQARLPFDLGRGPLLRAALLRLGVQDHILVVVMHHIIFDGWSEGLLLRELSALYEAYSQGEESPLPELDAQYADFALWQKEWLAGPLLELQLSYWRERLRGLEPLNLPTDRPRPAVETHRGSAAPFYLSIETTSQLVEMSRREGVTLFMTLLAGFQLLLSRYCGESDVTVVAAVANRNHGETEGLIGFFVNQLALRTDLSGDPSFRVLLGRVRAVTLGAYAHQDLPFERLVEALSPQRDLSRSPLSQVSLVFQNAPRFDLRIGDLITRRLAFEPNQAKSDLTLVVEERNGALSGALEYASDLFEVTTITRLIERLGLVFERVLSNPDEPISEIEYLTQAERDRILYEWNDTAGSYPTELCIHQLFEQQVRQTPDAIAVTQSERYLSYAQLERSAGQLAHYLARLGVGPDVKVALYLSRTPDLVIGLLGILKAGGAYVPIDPKYPAERVSFMLEDTHAAVVLTEEFLAHSLPANHSTLVCLDSGWKEIASLSGLSLNRAAGPDNLAYVIYTSGTSGRPKGVLVTHRSLVNSTTSRLHYYSEKVEKWLLLPSFAFDSSIAGIFGTFCQGGALALPAPDLESDPFYLAGEIADHRISHLMTVPSLYAELLELLNADQIRDLKVVIVAGESCPARLAARHRELLPQVSLFNEYGPTECAVWSTVFDSSLSDLSADLSIGRPIENTRVYILDERKRVVPIKVAGEFYIAGEGVARGYSGQAGQTAERFEPNPYSGRAGERMYRTGDKVRYLEDGRIEFLGRMDNQVKLRGYRIELSEIEAALSSCAGVRQAVVMAREDEAGEKRLVGYVVGTAEIAAEKLRTYLQEKLPQYMVPNVYVMLGELPLTPNGKVDRRALPSPEFGVSGSQYAEPRTAVEKIVARVFAEVLKLERVGINDNFFELGGHSLLAAKVISRVKLACNTDLSLRALFESPTVEGLARRVECAVRDGRGPSGPAPRRAGRSQSLPLSFAQQGLWFIHQLDPESAAYNVPGGLRLEGELDVAALKRSLQEIVRRHEALRTTFRLEREGPSQVISEDWRIVLPVIDLSSLAAGVRLDIAGQLAGEEAKRPFDLCRGPLLRCELLRLADRDHALVVNMHHIVSDEWSVGVMIEELTSLYESYLRGEDSPLSGLTLQYADFAVWQRESLTGEVLERQLAYWKKQLAGAPILDLPTDRPRRIATRYSSAQVSVQFTAQLTWRLEVLSRREGVTLFTTVMAAFQIALGRFAGQNDVVVGFPIANRTRPEFERLIGFLVNTLLLRTRWNNRTTIREILHQTHETVLGAQANQDLPFHRLREELPRVLGTDQNPLLRAMLIFQNTPASINIPGLSLSQIKIDGIPPARTDLDLYLSDTGDGLSGHFVYNSDLFDRHTIESISAILESGLNQMSRDLESSIDQIEDPIPAGPPPLTSASRNSGGAPLSYHQERIWFIDRFENGVVYAASPVYHNIPILVRFNGAIDGHLLEQSLNVIVARHDILRTRVVETDQGLRQVKRPYGILSLQRQEAKRASGEPSGRGWMAELALNHASVPFSLDRDLPIKASLLTVNDDTSILIIILHHLIADRRSGQIILRELAAIYTAQQLGVEPALPEPVITYSDYAEWQRNLSDRQLAPAWRYWRKQLAGNLKALELPLDRPRAAIHSFSAGWIDLAFRRDDLALIDRMARSGVTRNSLLLGCFMMLLRKYTGQEEIVTGASDACRRDAKIGDTFGPLANLLVLRNQINGDRTAIDILQEVAETFANANAHSLMPFDLLVQKLQPQIDMSRTALFDVLFQYEESTREGLSFGKTHGVYVENNIGYGKYDLNVLLHGESDELLVTVVYNADLMDRSTVERLMRHYHTLVRAVCLNPGVILDNIALLSEAETKEQILEWNRTEAPYPKSKTIHALFEEQAGKTPDSVAVKCGAVSLTYAELNGRANRLARFLQGRGVTRGSMVGVMLGRSIDLIVATFGILKAGAAYLPIDPGSPFDRARFMLNDGRAEHCITDDSQADRLRTVIPHVISFEQNRPEIDLRPSTDLTSFSDPADLAYCIYTSGSTGNPNGVMIQHNNVVRLMVNDAAKLAPAAHDVWTMFHSYSFDFSVWEMYGALLYGGTVIVVPDDARKDPNLFSNLLIEEHATVLSQTPSYFYRLLDSLLSGGNRTLPVKYIIFGAEALRPALLRQFNQTYPDIRLINMYGITETTVHVTYHELSGLDLESPESKIGAPIPTTATYVLDEGGNPVPIRVIGELYVGGEGLARGYLNRPELTAGRFTPDGVSGQCGARLYKTGDLARYHQDGCLEYAGRRDHQLKLRGYRIEIGEIEAALSSHAGVRQASVIAREDNSGEKRLVGYVVGEEIPGRALREYLQEKLPEYMIPSIFVTLKEMPLTANGKVDRKALPQPEFRESEQVYIAPRTAVEEIVAGIFAQVLKLDRVGREESFFELGGHSLLATQVISRVKVAFEAELALRALFESPTVEGMARQVEMAMRQGQALTVPELRRADRSGRLPLSFAQQRLWFSAQLEPESALYNVPAALRLKGELDVAALIRTLREIVRRHDVLRTSFAFVDGEPVQVIGEDWRIALPVVDLSSLAATETMGFAEELAGKEAKRPFDLSCGPLLRCELLRLAEQDHVLVVVLHHIISDGWSIGVLIRELTILYDAYTRGERSPLPELEAQYADFAVWQRKWLTGDLYEHQLSYWRKQLSGLEPLNLPTDRPRPAVASHRGSAAPFSFTSDVASQLIALSRREGATMFMTLLAGFQLLLSRYCGQQDVVVGTDVANRNRAETEDMIGFFVNQLILRTDFNGDPSFRALLKRVKEVTLSAYAHQDMPFERLVEEFPRQGDLSRSPLFQVCLALQNAPHEKLQLGQLSLEGFGTEFLEGFGIEFWQAEFDLTAIVRESGDALNGIVIYAKDLFDACTIERFIGHLREVLGRVVSNPDRPISEIEYLTEEERRQILGQWNDTAREYPREQCFVEMFEQQVRRSPGAVAIVSDGRSLTYHELGRRANELAYYLKQNGAGAEEIVGLFTERSDEMVIGVLGILKAGCAFLPLDPTYPQERLRFMIEDARLHIVLTQSGLVEKISARGIRVVCIDRDWDLIARYGPQNRLSPMRPENLAYVIYTSGSTGIPKGAMVERRGMLNHLYAKIADLQLTERDVIAQTASQSFDISVWQMLAGLLTGGRVEIIGDDVAHDATKLLEESRRRSVTVLEVVPSLLAVMLEHESRSKQDAGFGGGLRWLLVTGEPVGVGESSKWKRAYPDVRMLNAYGPTECSDDVTHYEISGREERSIPIGRGIQNTRLYVLDAWMGSVGGGIAGELYVGGDGVGRGYLNDAGKTAERFAPSPYGGTEGERIYRTGDIVRWNREGVLEFTGRKDQQIKIHGYRIEVGEIEAVLRRHRSVRQGVVMAREDEPGKKRLVAYVVKETGEVDEKGAELKESLVRQKLDQWTEVFDETYTMGQVSEWDPSFNMRLWINSYTLEPFPAEALLECVDDTVTRIEGLRPKRVLEIGCGTGQLLLRLAKGCEYYCGTDISKEALGWLKKWLESKEERFPHVELMRQAADDMQGIPDESFDVVVLNEIVQYFPNIEYLEEVMNKAIRKAKRGGAIFVGGVRRLQLLEAFHTTVQLERAAGEMRVEELRRQVRRQIAQEKELLIDEEFFVDLASRCGVIRDIEIQLKGGRCRNELTKYRYDVALWVKEDHEEGEGMGDSIAPEERRVIWNGQGLEWLKAELEETGPEVMRIEGVPNARVEVDLEAVALLTSGEEGIATVAEMRSALNRKNGAGGIEPWEMWKLGEERGYKTSVSWCPEDSGRYEALLMKRGVEGRKWRGKSSKSNRENGWRAFANDPMRKAGGESIVPELRKYLSEMLPGYMAPSVIIELTELPLTPNGKVDRKALPGPDLGLDEPEILAPRSAVEEILVRIFAEVLNIERVGIANSFFELGGHSLLATQVISRIEESLQIELPLRKLFENPTVADIAQAIGQNPQQRKIAEISAELLIKLDGLSEERIDEMLDERAGGETLK